MSGGMRGPTTAPTTTTTTTTAVGGIDGGGSGIGDGGGASSIPTMSDRSSMKQGTGAAVLSREGGGGVSPLIVFDWDDTMLTSSWIQSRELLQAGTYEDLPADARRSLAHLEQRYGGRLTVLLHTGWILIRFRRIFKKTL